MRQKLALIATLAPHTPFAILDEPTSNLDPTARSEVLQLVREAQGEGRTVLFSSHILSEIEQVCDRSCILRQGSVVHTQVMHDLRRQHRIHARLTGPMPAAPHHLVEGLTIEDGDDGIVVIQTPGELSPVLGWLASLPLSEVRIEPIGLQAVYDKYHAAEAA
jgi:ABC-2 type transport system ATP-binding protein